MSARPSSAPALSQAIEPCARIELDKHLVIRWRVARAALGASAPTGTSPIVHLEFRLCPGLGPTWVLIDPEHQTSRLIEPKSDSGPIQITRSPTRMTIESPHLRAHLCTLDQGSVELMYVRTDIFAELDIPGGRYEPIGCSLAAAGV